MSEMPQSYVTRPWHVCDTVSSTQDTRIVYTHIYTTSTFCTRKILHTFLYTRTHTQQKKPVCRYGYGYVSTQNTYMTRRLNTLHHQTPQSALMGNSISADAADGTRAALSASAPPAATCPAATAAGTTAPDAPPAGTA